MARKKPQTGDDAEDQVTVEGQALALAPPPDENPEQPTNEGEMSKAKRRIQRWEELPFTAEERLKVEEEIIAANRALRDVESEKSVQNKAWNAQISEHRETMDTAIDVLNKGCFKVSVERIEEMNYEDATVIYYDINTGDEIEEREMTEEELQTRMNL